MATNNLTGPLETQKLSLGNSIVAFLKSNESSLKSFILIKQEPSAALVKQKGPTFSKIGTYTPMDEAASVPCSSIALFCTRIDRPLEYAIEKNKYTDLYGVFLPNANDTSQFVMEVYSIVGTEQKPVKPMLMDLYRWEPVQKKMISVRVEVLVALTMVSPIIRERCEILQRDFESILEEDKRSIKTLLKYVDILYEATLKHMNTNLDRDVFHTVISRRKFADVERHLRKYLWDYSEMILANLVSVIRKNQTDLKDLQASSETSAFESTLNILVAFLNEMHPLILKNIRLDPQYVQEDVRVYLNTLIKAYIPTTSSSDPLSDHFIFLTDSSMCRPESKKPPTKLELLANLFDSPAFLDKQRKVSAFVKDMPIETRTSIQNGLKELLSKIYDTDMALTRSVRFLTVMLEKPDAAASDIMDIAIKKDDIERPGLLEFLSIGGPVKNSSKTTSSTPPAYYHPASQQIANETLLAPGNELSIPLNENPLRRTATYDDLSQDMNQTSLRRSKSYDDLSSGTNQPSFVPSGKTSTERKKERSALSSKPVYSAPKELEIVRNTKDIDMDNKDLPAVPQEQDLEDLSELLWSKQLPALPTEKIGSADPWQQDTETETDDTRTKDRPALLMDQ